MRCSDRSRNSGNDQRSKNKSSYNFHLTSFRSAPGLLSSSKDHGALPLRTSGYFLRRRPLAGVGADQVVSRARPTIVQLERQKMSRPFACRCTVSIRYPPVGSIKWSPSHRFADQNVVASCALVTTGGCLSSGTAEGCRAARGMHASPHLVRTEMVRDPPGPACAAAGRAREGQQTKCRWQGPIPIPKQPSSAKAVFRL